MKIPFNIEWEQLNGHERWETGAFGGREEPVFSSSPNLINGFVFILTVLLLVNATFAQKQEGAKVMDSITNFLVAADNGDTAKVVEGLNHGIDVNVTDEHGQTALILAADEGHVDTVKLLLRHGASPDLQNRLGGTALMMASFNDHLEVVTELLKAGADVNAKSKNGFTALMQVAVKPIEAAVQIINLLLDQKADINAQDKEGYTASEAESFDAVDIWEDLMRDEPEKAWPVFLELLARPHDDDTLEDIASWLGLLLRYHYDAFHERVKELVRGHDQLPRFLPDEALEKERFEEEEVADDEIIDSYLENHRHLRKHMRIDQLIAEDPDRALPLVLEIIHRGQDYDFGSYDLFSPLWDLLRRHVEAVIDRIEREALSSVMLRRCLWKMKLSQENTPPEYRIAEELWRRVKQAAGGTTCYNSELPEAVQPNRLSEEDEELLSSWFAYERTQWAYSLMWDLTDQNPERAWPIIKALVEAAPDDDTVSHIGAGPVQDLLSKHGEQFIERVEQQAAVDAKFRSCLTLVRPSRLTKEILRRLTRAIDYQ